MANSKVAFVIASQGYQQDEYDIPKKILEDAGYHIVPVSNKSGTAIARDESTTDVDVVLDTMNVDDYVGIFFIGGPGAIEHLDNEISYKTLQEAVSKNLPCGAICVSTRILAKAGILKGKRATGWDGDNELSGIYKEHDVEYLRQDVVIDGTVITSIGPSAAQQFGEDIIGLLQDQKTWG